MTDLFDEIDDQVEEDNWLEERVEEQERRGWKPKAHPTLPMPWRTKTIIPGRFHKADSPGHL